MKAFLLAAGRGERLRPLTDRIPKCLVPISGRPLLDIWLELCAGHGIGEVLINLHHLPGSVRDFVASRSEPPKVSLVFEETLLGSAGTVAANWSFVEGEPEFFVLYADNLTDVDLGRMLRLHRESGCLLTLGVVPTDRPREKGIVVTDENGIVTGYAEKPAQPLSHLANAGIYVAGPGLREHLPPPGATGDFGYDVLPRLLGRMAACRIDEYHRDIGTPDAYAAAQREWPARAGLRLPL